MKHEAYLSTAVTAAKKAGAFIKKNYARKHSVSYKDPHNIVSEVDIGAEKIIIDILSEQFPSHSIFSEEKGMMKKNSDSLWIIDPLDGTTNLAHHFPHFDVSIALAYKNELLVGVVYQPMDQELFTAQKGKGAFLNGERIQVSNCRHIGFAVATLTRGANKIEKVRGGKVVNALASEVRSIRMLGSAALDFCYVAAGRFDAIVTNGCMPHDAAASALIAKEAGAVVTDFEENPWTFRMDPSDLVAANPLLHKKLIPIVKNI